MLHVALFGLKIKYGYHFIHEYSQHHHIMNPKNTNFENKGNCLEKGKEKKPTKVLKGLIKYRLKQTTETLG